MMFNQTGKAQAVLEYLIAYSWLIIIILIVVIYFFIFLPSSLAVSRCAFTANLNCNNIVLGSNGPGATPYILISLTNQQQYPLQNVSVLVNISGTLPVTARCNPNFVLPGGTIICNATVPNSLQTGALLNGNMYAKATVCAIINTPGCKVKSNETIAGTFISHSVSFVPKPSCVITITSQKATLYGYLAKASITTNIKIIGYPIAGATLLFKTNSSSSRMVPNVTSTDSNGNATAFLFGTPNSNVNVTANFGSLCNSTQSVSLNPNVAYVIYQMNQPNPSSSEPIVDIDKINYTELPITIAYDFNSLHPYNFYSPVIVPLAEKYTFLSLSGCGLSTQAGTLKALGNCTVKALYLFQYYLNEIADPPQGGALSPGSGWFTPNTLVTISETTNTNYNFNGWTCTGSGCYTGLATSNTIKITNPIKEIAHFSPQYLSCFYSTQYNANCATTSGFFVLNSSGLWQYIASSPPGASSLASAVSCFNVPGSLGGCVTPNGYYTLNSTTLMWQSIGGSPGATQYQLSCFLNNSGVPGCDTKGGYYYTFNVTTGWQQQAHKPGGSPDSSALSCYYFAPLSTVNCSMERGYYILNNTLSWNLQAPPPPGLSAPPGLTSQNATSCFYTPLALSGCVSVAGYSLLSSTTLTWSIITPPPPGTTQGDPLTCYWYPNTTVNCGTATGFYTLNNTNQWQIV